MPIVEFLSIVKDGFSFLNGIVTNLQLNNFMMVATSIIVNEKFSLTRASKSWLKQKSVNAFSHCFMHAKFNISQAMEAYHRMLQNSYQLVGGRFIIDDTMEHHSKYSKLIHGVFKHWDHVFNSNLSAKCIVFLYYSDGAWIKFPIGWKIYYRDMTENKNTNESKKKSKIKTKNTLAIELIEEALNRGFACEVVLADSWFCVEPFIKELQRLKLNYILEIKKNATIQKPVKEIKEKRRGPKRTKWYEKVKIIPYMESIKSTRTIGFEENKETNKPEQVLYVLKERVCKIHALPGKHKIIRSFDPKRETEKYLITNQLTWEGVKIVKEYFNRWVIEEFFRNAKQQLNMEGACVRSEQGVTIALFLITCIDSLFHKKIAELVSTNSQSGPITVQSIARLCFLENAENFVEKIRSRDGNEFLDKWLGQLRDDAIRLRHVKSNVIYVQDDCKEPTENVA